MRALTERTGSLETTAEVRGMTPTTVTRLTTTSPTAPGTAKVARTGPPGHRAQVHPQRRTVAWAGQRRAAVATYTSLG